MSCNGFVLACSLTLTLLSTFSDSNSHWFAGELGLPSQHLAGPGHKTKAVKFIRSSSGKVRSYASRVFQLFKKFYSFTFSDNLAALCIFNTMSLNNCTSERVRRTVSIPAVNTAKDKKQLLVLESSLIC